MSAIVGEQSMKPSQLIKLPKEREELLNCLNKHLVESAYQVCWPPNSTAIQNYRRREVAYNTTLLLICKTLIDPKTRSWYKRNSQGHGICYAIDQFTQNYRYTHIKNVFQDYSVDWPQYMGRSSYQIPAQKSFIKKHASDFNKYCASIIMYGEERSLLQQAAAFQFGHSENRPWEGKQLSLRLSLLRHVAAKCEQYIDSHPL